MRWVRSAAVAACVSQAAGHSWVACTDYRVQNPTQAPQGLAETDPSRLVYDDTKCRGYPRDWTEWNGECGFACDRGYNYQPGDGPACKTPRGDSGDYSARFPAATYVPGQVVCVAHTVKNHVAAPCTNPYIPDHGQHFYIAGPGLTADPSMAVFRQKELANFDQEHVVPSYDYKGFQNAPAFCDNKPSMDRATGTACFKIPESTAPGRYSFLWHWAFNSDEDVYTTCWEADVVGVAPPSPAPKPSPAPPTPKPSTPSPTTSSAPAPGPPVAPNPKPAIYPYRRICFDARHFSEG